MVQKNGLNDIKTNTQQSKFLVMQQEVSINDTNRVVNFQMQKSATSDEPRLSSNQLDKQPDTQHDENIFDDNDIDVKIQIVQQPV